MGDGPNQRTFVDNDDVGGHDLSEEELPQAQQLKQEQPQQYQVKEVEVEEEENKPVHEDEKEEEKLSWKKIKRIL